MKLGKKYQFHYNPGTQTVVCTTFYKGQTVRGVAKCNPDDNFDIDVGKKLALLRCRQKLARKKIKRARKVYDDALCAEIKAKHNFGKATDFLNDSAYQLDLATNELINFERELSI